MKMIEGNLSSEVVTIVADGSAVATHVEAHVRAFELVVGDFVNAHFHTFRKVVVDYCVSSGN